MKHKTLTLFLALLISMVTSVAFAYDAKIDGIYYNFSGSNATVTYRTTSYNSYSGDIVIPETVTYNETTYSVTSIGECAFYECSYLTSVTIPESVTSIGYDAFRGCTGLTSITIPEGVTSIGSGAFSGCTGLTSITIPEGVTSIGSGAFSGCSGLESIVVEAGNTMYDSRNNCNAIIEMSSNTLIAGCKNTTIPESVTSIGEHAFYGCSSLTFITIPESVTSIGNRAFYGCSGLTSVTIPESVTSIGNYAFSDCYFTYDSFVNNSSLSSSTTWGATLYDAEETEEGLLIKDGVARRCRPWATTITIPEGVTSIGEYAFLNCSGLTSVTIPEGVTSIGEYAFRGCTGLTSVTIGNGVTSIGDCAFENCTGLTSVTIPGSVTSIGNEAFENCTGLTFVTIGNGVTSIGSYAFRGCTGLTSVTIGNGVTSISGDAFSGCKLRNLSVRRETPPRAYTNSFSEQTQYHTTLYIPVGAWDAYAYDDAWYKFINIRETAMESNEVAPENAYTLMNAKDFTYAVYDPVNDCVGTVSSVGVNEDNPNHCWQTVEVSGKKFLYNIGAKKFAVPATDGSSFTLSETVGSVEMTDGMDGIVLNGHTETQWALVLNESMNTDKTVEDVVVTAIEKITDNENANNSPIYDLNGRQITKPTKGIYIKDGKRVMIR